MCQKIILDLSYTPSKLAPTLAFWFQHEAVIYLVSEAKNLMVNLTPVFSPSHTLKPVLSLPSKGVFNSNTKTWATNISWLNHCTGLLFVLFTLTLNMKIRVCYSLLCKCLFTEDDIYLLTVASKAFCGLTLSPVDICGLLSHLLPVPLSSLFSCSMVVFLCFLSRALTLAIVFAWNVSSQDLWQHPLPNVIQIFP